MTDTSVQQAPPIGEGHGATDHHGPADKYYYRIAIILALVTAAEVIWSYLPLWDDAHGLTSFVEVAGLIVMMLFKFVFVASNFMHLKFDDKILTRLFYAGFALAIGVYLVALCTFQIFSSAPHGYR
ncbi:hypothetical protein BH10ACT1_BH10ACT1_19780 [soil metagenome]